MRREKQNTTPGGRVPPGRICAALLSRAGNPDCVVVVVGVLACDVVVGVCVGVVRSGKGVIFCSSVVVVVVSSRVACGD